MFPNKSKPVDRAVPVLRKPKANDAAKVASARATVTAMQASGLWNTNPALQATGTAWNTVTDALDANVKVVADLRNKLAAAVSAQRALRRDWTDAMRHTTASVAVATQGSADQVHELGFDVRTQAMPGNGLAVPSGLTTVVSKTVGEAIVKWARGQARHGFIVQHATDVANAATISLPIPCTKATFKLQGLPSGSIVHVRVAAIDPTSPSGHTEFTDWVPVSAR